MTNATNALLVAACAALKCSDYRIAKLLGISSPSVSRWRTSTGHMSDDHAARLAELAGLDPAEWVLRIAAEREPDGPGTAAMRDAIRRLSGRAAAVILTVAAACMAAPESSANAAVSALSSAPDHLTNVYIMRTTTEPSALP